MRPQILFPLFAPVGALKGVGPRLAPLVVKTAGPLVRDLAFLKPQDLILRRPCTVAEAADGEAVIHRLLVEAHYPSERPGRPYRILAGDGTGSVLLVWFRGHGPHLQRAHPVGATRLASGRAETYGGARTIAHPDHLLPEERAEEILRVEPVYAACAGLPSRTLRRLVQEALRRAPDLPEWQDPDWLRARGWPPWREALVTLHAPRGPADLLPTSPARQRLAYDELLAHQLAMAQRKKATAAEPAAAIQAGALSGELEAALPFVLTGAQRRCVSEIRADLAAGRRMSRIVQGDVGSGKTVVAMLAMADVAASGGQSALMAPTDILARQHFATVAGRLERVGVKVVCLTGRDKGAQRKAKLQALASGEAGAVVGTHALFQDDVSFQRLALAIIDEQHRFGVFERRRLQSKGQAVHMLALSATPIPRTLELTLYGDLDVSRLDEKPPGRRPVETTASPSAREGTIVQRLKAAVDRGAQAFWICPLVAESDLLDVTAAETRAGSLKASIGEQVGLVHGKMPAAQKDQVMAAFAEGRLKVLVATTVVEVGVDVPQASIMVIEHAERFGLAQLHQLRGRVGRGGERSACLLLYDPPLSASAKARLQILRDTDDGFLIAEKDLELRGGGDLVGLRQSGFPDYRFADPDAHRTLLAAAADDARLALLRDPTLQSGRGRALAVLQALFDWREREGWAAAG